MLLILYENHQTTKAQVLKALLASKVFLVRQVHILQCGKNQRNLQNCTQMYSQNIAGDTLSAELHQMADIKNQVSEVGAFSNP